MTLSIKSLQISPSLGEPLFEPLSFTVESGNVFSLMGPSGCGKSTLLKVISGHLSSDFNYTGSVSLDGVNLCDLEPHQRKVGILFQEDLLFPHLNIWQNLAFALPNSVKGKQRKTEALDALTQIGLHHLANSTADQVSGGQRSRISLLRCLLAKPQALLLDEPFSKLDKHLRDEFRQWVFAQIKAHQLPAIMVTHDLEDVPDREALIKLGNNDVR
jgi:putative thiamine transport system ATP-binding protein